MSCLKETGVLWWAICPFLLFISKNPISLQRKRTVLIYRAVYCILVVCKTKDEKGSTK